MPSPFACAPPHPLAERGCELLQEALAAGRFETVHDFFSPGGGKMFGTLVVRDRQGRLGYLHGFSGMIGGRWNQEGFVGPLFSEEERDRFWAAGSAQLDTLNAAVDEAEAGPKATSIRARHAALLARQEDERNELAERHKARKRARAQARSATAVGPGGEDVELTVRLAQESRADKAERKEFKSRFRRELDASLAVLRQLDEERAALIEKRTALSNELLSRLQDGYTLRNAGGEAFHLRDVFAPRLIPGGAGDCAGPKLIGSALAHGLQPIVMAEFWWGASPATGGRHHRHYYPACRGKCLPLLPAMLRGLAVDEPPLYGNRELSADEPRVVFEDEWIVVVDKPSGLLSIPGRGGALRDCVQRRLRARSKEKEGPWLVHRLDLDTSGLLMAAKSRDVHRQLQRLFLRRKVHKEYLAWVEGQVVGDAGMIDLPLRVDLDDRPRQIVDAVHGKQARTRWRVLERRDGRSLIAFTPITGRTHQLRVHASHHEGLACSIVGDRLYGRAGPRLMLHAHTLRFVHPITDREVSLCSPAPF